MTTGVEGCNKLAIAEFWSKFNADLEPLDERAELPPAEAAERTLAVLLNGKVGVTGTTPVEVVLPRGVAVDFVTGAMVVGAVPLMASVVVCETCPAATSDVGASRDVWEEVVGAGIETIVGRLVNVRCCVNGAAGSESEGFAGSIGLVMCVGSTLGGWRIVP